MIAMITPAVRFRLKAFFLSDREHGGHNYVFILVPDSIRCALFCIFSLHCKELHGMVFKCDYSKQQQLQFRAAGWLPGSTPSPDTDWTDPLGRLPTLPSENETGEVHRDPKDEAGETWDYFPPVHHYACYQLPVDIQEHYRANHLLPDSADLPARFDPAYKPFKLTDYTLADDADTSSSSSSRQTVATRPRSPFDDEYGSKHKKRDQGRSRRDSFLDRDRDWERAAARAQDNAKARAREREDKHRGRQPHAPWASPTPPGHNQVPVSFDGYTAPGGRSRSKPSHAHATDTSWHTNWQERAKQELNANPTSFGPHSFDHQSGYCRFCGHKGPFSGGCIANRKK